MCRCARTLLSMEVEAVIFDLDGTLFDHAGAARDAAAAWLSALGHEPTEALLGLWFELEERFFAVWNRRELDWQGQRRARVREMLVALEQQPGDDAALDASFALYLAGYEQSWRAFEDAAPALAALSAVGMPVAVLTNGAEAQQQAKLAACGLQQLTGSLFSSDRTGFCKPDPGAYLHVCDALGVPAARVLHVGDRHDVDVLGAQAAGLRAIHLNRTSAELPRGSDRIGTLRDLPGCLGLTELAD